MLIDVTDDKTGEVVQRFDTRDMKRFFVDGGKKLYAEMKTGEIELLHESEDARRYLRNLRDVFKIFSPNFKANTTGFTNFLEGVRYENNN